VTGAFMSNILIIILLILLLTFIIVVISMITGFGKIVASGGNLQKVFTDLFDSKRNAVQKEKEQEPNDETVPIKMSRQVMRIVGGLLFGVLMLYPLLYKTRINGEPFININHQVRFYLLCFLIASALIVFLVIWIQDRKPK
jgi:hypothetical protein